MCAFAFLVRCLTQMLAQDEAKEAEKDVEVEKIKEEYKAVSGGRTCDKR